MGTQLLSKEALRSHFRSITIAEKRLREKQAIEKLRPLISSFSLIISYVPLGLEVDITELNEEWMGEGKLLLPCIQELEVGYRPLLKKEHLKKSAGFFQPISGRFSNKIPSQACLLIPALAYDKQGYRLGHGMGFYDRLIAMNPHVRSFGIAFKEQKIQEEFPLDPWDRSVQKVLYF